VGQIPSAVILLFVLSRKKINIILNYVGDFLEKERNKNISMAMKSGTCT
jgi:hypothetical protein